MCQSPKLKNAGRYRGGMPIFRSKTMLTKVEKHTPVIWWVMRIVEMITCIFMIAGVIHNW